MLQAFRKLNFEDKDLNRLQQEAAQVLESITQIKLLDGVLIDSLPDTNNKTKPLTLSTVTVMVPHGLNREYQGFLLVDSDSAAIVYRDNTVLNTDSGKENDKARFIPLKASASVNVKVWVF